MQNDDLRGKKLGLPKNYLGEGLDPEIEQAVRAACEQLAALGAEIVEFEMPMIEYAVPAYYIIACAEASSNLSRYDGIKYGYHPESFADLEDLYLTARSQGFGPEVKRRIMLGTFALMIFLRFPIAYAVGLSSVFCLLAWGTTSTPSAA